MGDQKKKSEKLYRQPLFFGEERKKRSQLRALSLAQEHSPIHLEKYLSWCEFELGIRRDSAKAMVMVLADIGLIEVNESTQKLNVTKLGINTLAKRVQKGV